MAKDLLDERLGIIRDPFPTENLATIIDVHHHRTPAMQVDRHIACHQGPPIFVDMVCENPEHAGSASRGAEGPLLHHINNRRLHSEIDNRPPAELEALFYDQQPAPTQGHNSAVRTL